MKSEKKNSTFVEKFEKVEKTGIISTKFLLRCTPSVILGVRQIDFHLQQPQSYAKLGMQVGNGAQERAPRSILKLEFL